MCDSHIQTAMFMRCNDIKLMSVHGRNDGTFNKTLAIMCDSHRGHCQYAPILELEAETPCHRLRMYELLKYRLLYGLLVLIKLKQAAITQLQKDD